MSEEPIWAQEYPTVSAQVTSDGQELVIELATGRASVSASLTAGDVAELFDALNEWLRQTGQWSL